LAHASPRSAAIIAIGSEMLGPVRLDTNSLKLTVMLDDFGVEVARKSVVGDKLDDLVAEIEFSFSRADILIMTGGLGPTEDDLTREGPGQGLRPADARRAVDHRPHRKTIRRPGLENA
jgi:nicotinamide-nucleotide amidase